jgi:hypothetical protein
LGVGWWLPEAGEISREGSRNVDQWSVSYSYAGERSSDVLLQSRVTIDNSNELYIGELE